MKRIVFVLLSVITFFTSCRWIGGEHIEGNGKIITVNRSVSSFNSVDAGGNFEVHLTQGPLADVRIETDENLMQYIVVRTDGDELVISTEHNTNLDPTGKIKVFVSAPLFKRIEASGASNIYSDTKISSAEALNIGLSGASEAKLELQAPLVDADLSGASNLNLKGETKKFNAGGSGASNIKAYDLLTENADVVLSGASNAEIFASVNLKVEASGASSTKYKGSPSVNQNVSGAGSVSKVD